MSLLALSLWFGLFSPFFPGLGFGSAGLSFFSFHICSCRVRSLEKTHARRTGLSWLGFDMVELGFFCSYHSTVYTLLHNNYVLCVCQSYHTYLGGLFTYLEYVHVFFCLAVGGIILLSSNRGRLVRVSLLLEAFCVAVFCLVPVCGLVVCVGFFIDLLIFWGGGGLSSRRSI